VTALNTNLPEIRPVAPQRHLIWLGAGLLVGFAVPFVFTNMLTLPRDLYYAIYAVVAIGFFVLWARSTQQSLAAMVRRRWVLAVVLGLAVAVILGLIVLRTEPASSGSHGARLVWDVLWRGVVYGAVDGLFLSSFPILAVFAAFTGTRLRARTLGKIGIGVAALIASMLMTTAYHLGYSDFRSPKIARPVAGDVVWSVPTLVTLNPIGAPIAHAGMHVAAVLHSPQTDTFLPPHQ
jgi:hypothetical protein